MRNTNHRDQQGNLIRKPSCIMAYNLKMGGVDRVDQQLHSISVMRKSYKWYKKVFFRVMMVCVLSAHKLYQQQRERSDFLAFLHDIITQLLVNTPRLKENARIPRGNILRLTGRHFPGTLSYEGTATKKKNK